MPNPWYTPTTAHEAVQTLENLEAVTAFIKDVVSQAEFSDNGKNGLCLLLGLMERCMNQSVKLLVKEVYRGKR